MHNILILIQHRIFPTIFSLPQNHYSADVICWSRQGIENFIFHIIYSHDACAPKIKCQPMYTMASVKFCSIFYKIHINIARKKHQRYHCVTKPLECCKSGTRKKRTVLTDRKYCSFLRKQEVNDKLVGECLHSDTRTDERTTWKHNAFSPADWMGTDMINNINFTAVQKLRSPAIQQNHA